MATQAMSATAGAKPAAKPLWITAKYQGFDYEGTPVRKGDRVLFFPTERRIYIGRRAEYLYTQSVTS